MIITLIPKEYLEEFWPKAMPFIQMALDEAPGYYRLADVLHNILQDMEALWAVIGDDGDLVCCFTTMINQYPLCKKLLIHHVGGSNIEEWEDECYDILKRYAKDVGCDGINALGRNGWRRKAKERNWKAVTMYSFELEA